MRPQPKWDGYRFQVIKHGDWVRLFSKSRAEYTGRLERVAEAFRKLLSHSAVLDGELCFIGADGLPSFHRLMAEMRSKWPDESAPVFMPFDLLHQDGPDLRQRPLSERKRDLDRLCRNARIPFMHQVQIFPDGEVLFEHCGKYGFEGIVSKRAGRPYVSGRSKCWVKVKCPNWKRDNQDRFRLFEAL